MPPSQVRPSVSPCLAASTRAGVSAGPPPPLPRKEMSSHQTCDAVFQKTFGAYCIQPGSCPPRKRQDGLRGHINQTLLFPTTDERNPTLCAKSLFEKYTSSPVHRTMGRIFDRMAHSTLIWGRKRPGGFARLCGRKRGDGVPDLGGTTLDGRTIGHNLFDGFW